MSSKRKRATTTWKLRQILRLSAVSALNAPLARQGTLRNEGSRHRDNVIQRRGTDGPVRHGKSMGTALAHGPCNQPVHQGRGRDLCAAAQRAAPPNGDSVGTSSLRVDNSSSSSRVSASAVSGVTSYCSTKRAARSSAVRRPSTCRHRKLPVS